MSNQFKKLLYDKKFVDTSEEGGALARWRLAPWKVFLILVSVLMALLIVYAFLATPDPSNFLGNIVFYAIVLIGATAVVWIVGAVVYKGRKLLAGFFLAFILILTFYWFLGFLLNHFSILSFQMGGYSLWILVTVLAGLGSSRIDSSLDRNDVFYGLLVFIICIGSNIPIANGQGFLWNLDNLIIHALGWGSILTNNLGIILW